MASKLQTSDLSNTELNKIEKMKYSIQSIFSMLIGHTSNLVKINQSIDLFCESEMNEEVIAEQNHDREKFFGQMKLKQQTIIADLDQLNQRYAKCKTQVESFIKTVNESEQDYEIISLAREQDGVIIFPVCHENNEDKVVETLTKLMLTGDQMIQKIELQQKKIIEKTETLIDQGK